MKLTTLAGMAIGIAWSLLPFFACANDHGDSAATPNLQYGHASNWMLNASLADQLRPVIDWRIKIGTGRSQVVGTDNTLYVTSGSVEKRNEKQVVTRTRAIDISNGKTKWSYEHSAKHYDTQESFGGDSRSPQSTPAVSGDRVFVVGYAGQLICLNRVDGTLIWKKDLVSDLGADPVQFGFSASPLVDQKDSNRIYVLAAGKRGGLYCLNAKQGQVIWRADCETFSYATPVEAKLGGIEQVVAVSQEAVFGIARNDGRRLWSYPMPEKGLTNVPTPLKVDDSHLLVSGQGIKGTRCLKISSNGGTFQVEEIWHNRKLQFFYTNWAMASGRVAVGCTERFLVAFDVQDGSMYGQWRGFGDGNVALNKERIMILDGKGRLSVLDKSIQRFNWKGLIQKQKWSVADGRCWTPISAFGSRFVIRCDDELICLQTTGESKQQLTNVLNRPKSLEFKTTPLELVASDSVERIFSVFETQGQQAAVKLYQQLRNETPSKLTVKDRVELVNAAIEQGLNGVAKMVLADSLQDFPNSADIKSLAKSILD